MKGRKGKPIFEEKGSIRVGNSYWLSSNIVWPGTKIEVFKEKLVLYYLSSTIELKKSDIKYVEKYKGFFSEGVRIYHNKKEAPSFIVFWLFYPEGIINKMKKMGYKIKPIKKKKK